MWSPVMLSTLADARIAIKRIQSLMEAEEVTFSPQRQAEMREAISISHGTFGWASIEGPARVKSELEKPIVQKSTMVDRVLSFVRQNEIRKSESTQKINGDTELQTIDTQGKDTVLVLKDINLKIPRGSLCAIVGTIGAGKSSLLSCIVGQMHAMDKDAKVVLNGNIGTL